MHRLVASEREGIVQGYQGEPVKRHQGDAEHPRDSRQRAVRVECRQVLRAHAQRRGDPRQNRRRCPLSGKKICYRHAYCTLAWDLTRLNVNR